MAGAACAVCGVRPATAPLRSLPPGTRLGRDRYVVGRLMGEGGFGLTYKGACIHTRSPVAIKELFPERAGRRGLRVSLPGTDGAWTRPPQALRDGALQEADALGRMHTRHIVKVLDAFPEHDTVYIVMELLRGPTLAEALQAGPQPAARVRTLAADLCDALTEVHGAGLLHRDIKPDNIVLAKGRCVLIDFGSARTYAPGVTVSHTRILTTDYAAPEMFGTKGRLGPAADLFCLAATLWHALVGSPPPSVVDRLLGQPLPAHPALRSRMGQAVLRSLSIAAADRHDSAADFKADLRPQIPIRAAGGTADHAGVLLEDAVSVPVQGVRFAPDGGSLVAWSPAHMSIWDVVDGCLRSAASAGDALWVRFAPDGGSLVVADVDAVLHVLDRDTLSPQVRMATDSLPDSLHPDFDRGLVSGCTNAGARIWWSLATGRPVRREMLRLPEFPRHMPGRTATGVARSRNGAVLAAWRGAHLWLWNFETGSLLCRVECRPDHSPGPGVHIRGMGFAPGGSVAAVADGDGVHLHRVDTGNRMHALSHPHYRPADLQPGGMRFSPDGRFLMGGGECHRLDELAEDWFRFRKCLVVWDTNTGRGRSLNLPGEEFKADLGYRTLAAWGAQGGLAGGFCHGRTLALWNPIPDAHDAVPRVLDVQDLPRCLASGPSGTGLLACGTHTGAVRVWSGLSGF